MTTNLNLGPAVELFFAILFFLSMAWIGVWAILDYYKDKGKKMKAVAALFAVGALAACENDARIASSNLSKAADMFEIDRRVIFYNGISGEYMLSLEGRCSIEDQKHQLEVTCKTGPDAYKKHFLGLSDNVTYFAEQLAARAVSTYHYRVIFKPQSIIPDIDARGDAGELRKLVQ